MVTLSHTHDGAPARRLDRPMTDAIVASAGIFQAMQPEAVAQLTDQLHPVHFSPGQCVYREGEPGDRLYITTAGKVKIGRSTADDICDLIFTDATGRVARQLLRLAQRFGVQDQGAIRVDHGLTQDELAQLVGVARETVNKVLIDFVQRGWILVDGKSVLIVESESLLRRANPADA